MEISVSGDEKWVSVSPESGKASSEAQTITVTTLENAGTDRTATITFKTGTVSDILKVTQDGAIETTYAKLADVRAMAKGNIPANTVVKAVMISNNKELGNMTSFKNVYVQDETAGIQIRFTANNDTFLFGDELEINLSGQELSEYNGSLQINNLPNENVKCLSSGNTVTAKDVTVADFIANKYESQYVAVPGVQVVEADLNKTFVVGDDHTYIGMEDAEGNTFDIFSSKYSEFATTKVPQGSGTIKGIASISGSNIQIIFAQLSDFEGLTGERFEVTEPDPGPAPTPGEPDIFFSEYVEGSSNNKYLEIYNPTEETVDLSQYMIDLNTNGGPSWSRNAGGYDSSVELSGTLAPGAVIVYKHKDAALYSGEATVCGAVNFNGNDPVGLFKNGVLIDIIGTFNGGSADFAKDATLRRKSSVKVPSATYNAEEWETLSKDDVSGLGSHTIEK